MIEVRFVRAEETYDIRHKVLRPHQTPEACIYDTDSEKDTFHIGVFYKGVIASVVSFNMESLPDFPYEKQYRLRAMATLEPYRNMGLGKAAVVYAQERLKASNIPFIWCKGRTGVQGYYEKLGFQRRGDVFDYPPIGPHLLMVKEL